MFHIFVSYLSCVNLLDILRNTADIDIKIKLQETVTGYEYGNPRHIKKNCWHNQKAETKGYI